MGTPIIDLDKVRDDKWEYNYRCDCGSFTYFLSPVWGLVCTECDGYHPEFTITHGDKVLGN